MPTRIQNYRTRVAAALNLTQEQAKEYEPLINLMCARGYTVIAAVAYLKVKQREPASAQNSRP